MSPGWALLAGAGGAAAAEFLPIFDLRYTPRESWPDWTRRWSYYLVTFIGVVIGGLIAFASASDMAIRWYVAVNIGAAWPLIIKGAAKAAPEPKPPPETVD
jgi:hypothetical protein